MMSCNIKPEKLDSSNSEFDIVKKPTYLGQILLQKQIWKKINWVRPLKNIFKRNYSLKIKLKFQTCVLPMEQKLGQ